MFMSKCFGFFHVTLIIIQHSEKNEDAQHTSHACSTHEKPLSRTLVRLIVGGSQVRICAATLLHVVQKWDE